jgi:hypothetical protein
VVEALGHKPKDRGFETRLGELIFQIYLISPAALGPGDYSASNRNVFQQQEIIFLGTRARSVRRADNLAVICEPIV